jgi:hypothetical protein
MYKDLILFGTLTMRKISARRNEDTQKKVVNMIIDYLIENIDTKSLLLINEEEPNIIKTKLILLERKYHKDKDLIDNYFNHHENLCNLLLHYNTLDKIINGNLKTAFISTLGYYHIGNTNMRLHDYVRLAYNAKLIDINISQNKIQINKEKLNIKDLIKLMLLSISGYISLKNISFIDFQINLPSEKLESLFYIRKIKNYDEEFQLRVNLIKDKHTLPYEDVLGKEEALFFNYFSFLENMFLLPEEFNQLKTINESNYIKYEECKLKIQLQNF